MVTQSWGRMKIGERRVEREGRTGGGIRREGKEGREGKERDRE
jgi:hypothetical protein